MNTARRIKGALADNNPLLAGLFGLCPALAASVSLRAALILGAVVTVVLTAGDLFVAAVGRRVPTELCVVLYLLMASGLVCAVETVCGAYFPDMATALALILPFAAVNSLTIQRSTEPKRGIGRAALGGFFTGVVYTLTVFVIAAVRELFGAGTLFADFAGNGGVRLPETFRPAQVLLLPCGAFLVFGICAAAVKCIAGRMGDTGDTRDE